MIFRFIRVVRLSLTVTEVTALPADSESIIHHRSPAAAGGPVMTLVTVRSRNSFNLNFNMTICQWSNRNIRLTGQGAAAFIVMVQPDRARS
jgi:hypothetical protein